MKASNAFKETIKAHLDQMAQANSMFAERYANEKKNLDDCCTYIMNTVQKMGVQGLADAEVFGMAVHYYQEDNVEVGKPVNAKVIVNHVVELSAEDIAQAKKAALDKVIAEEQNRITKKAPAKKKEEAQQQPSLF